MNYIKQIISAIFYLLILSLPVNIFAEDLKEWGVVRPEFLNMTVYPEDTSAAAIRIFDIESIDLRLDGGVELMLERHFQTKILKEKGKEHADVAISYWHKDVIRDIEAQIILPSGEKIELDDEKIFDEEAKDWYKVKKLTFPNVQIGAILEVKYKQKSTAVYELRPWYFHNSIPVIESEITLQMAPFFSYFVRVGNDPGNIIQQSKDKSYNNHRRNWEDRFRFKAVNLPAIKNEPFVSTLNNYKAYVNFQIESVNFMGRYTPYIQDLQTLCNTLLDEDYNDFEEPESDVEKIVGNLINPQMNNDTKARVIFEYVRDNFDSDKNTGIYVRKDQDEILEQKKASDSEKNMLLKVMLQAAGFEVIPAIISTIDHGTVNPEIPFLSQYNKVILLVKVDTNFYLFDARDPWITYGQLPPTSLVNNALIIQKDNSSFLSIPNTGIRSLNLIESKINIQQNGMLTGTSEIMAIGYGSRDYNSKLYKHKNMSALISEEISDKIEGFTVTETDSGLKATPADSFNTSFAFKLENYAEIIDNEIYFKPCIYFSMDKNEFISEKRVFPIEFGFLRKSIETTYFTLPENLSINELPKDILIENEYYKYKRTLVLTQKAPLTIGFSRQFEIKSLAVPADEYSKIKNDFSKIVDADQEIIIIKISKQDI